MPDAADILIVDDQEPNRDLLRRRMLALGYRARTAENGADALAEVGRRHPDLILLDLNMPVMDGFEVLRRLKGDAATRHLPVIIISAVDEMESIAGCIQVGADDYLPKPFNATLLKARVTSSLEKKRLREQEIESAQLATIFALSKLAESRDLETGKHLERMREYCKILAARLAALPAYRAVIDAEFIENLYAASPLHDIGKVGVPDSILQKAGPLTAEEFAVMKNHTLIGAATLRAVESEHPGNTFIRLGIQIAESHHEKWDGGGYPHGLAGTAIPLVGRLLALGDVYDALTSRRRYKAALTPEAARDQIVAGRGRHFDPDMVDAFLAVEDAFREVRRRFQDEDDAGG
jgi:putative two-component system response regulator